MNRKQHRNQKNAAKLATNVPTVTGQSIRMQTVEMTESMAYEMTLEMLAEQYNEGGYLAFIQAMVGFVHRYDTVLSDAESQGQDERMCRAVGATDIALTFIPGMRNELAKLAAY